VLPPADKSFLDLDDAELAGRVSSAKVEPDYRAGVLDNLRRLQGHARRVAAALGGDPGADEPLEPFRP